MLSININKTLCAIIKIIILPILTKISLITFDNIQFDLCYIEAK